MTTPPARRVPARTVRETAPDNSELAARLRLLVNRLARRLRSQASTDLSPSLTSALVTIERQGPITLGQLATRERVTPPSITRAVASLERLGLVQREAHPHDRRITYVTVTADGEHTVQLSRTRKTAFLAKRLRELDAAELDAVRAALPLLERLLEDDG